MSDYFLHHEKDPQYKALRDFYHRPNPIKARRTSRSWTITGIKRRKGMLKWTHSLAGRRFYRKLALHKALHEHFHLTIIRQDETYTEDYLKLMDYLLSSLGSSIGRPWYDGNSICIFDRDDRGVITDIFLGGGSAFVAMCGEVYEFADTDYEGILKHIGDYAKELYREVDTK